MTSNHHFGHLLNHSVLPARFIEAQVSGENRHDSDSPSARRLHASFRSGGVHGSPGTKGTKGFQVMTCYLKKHVVYMVIFQDQVVLLKLWTLEWTLDTLNNDCVKQVLESISANLLHSLKLTATAPENRPFQKETIVFQPSIFRYYVMFVSGRWSSLPFVGDTHVFNGADLVANALLPWWGKELSSGERNLKNHLKNEKENHRKNHPSPF